VFFGIKARKDEMAKPTKKSRKSKSSASRSKLLASLKPDPNYVKLLGRSSGSQAKA
jgi:hypothetical protein